ncbi:hypothetical protein [Nonlabens sp.]|uniref:hypothetical protein n=1 Tax=Nonlabens sp. TaxID=1888209 RepID=UPI003266AD55
MKNIYKLLFLAGIIFAFSSCEKDEVYNYNNKNQSFPFEVKLKNKDDLLNNKSLYNALTALNTNF